MSFDIIVARVTFQGAGPFRPWARSILRAYPVWAHLARTFVTCGSKEKVSVIVTPRIFILVTLVTPHHGGGTDKFWSFVRGLCMIISMDLDVLSMRLLVRAHSDICSSSMGMVWELEE